MADARIRYGLFARIIHWLTVLMVFTMVPAGIVMTKIGSGPLQNQLFHYHRSMGFVLLVVTLIRLIYRLRVQPPPLPAEIPLFQRIAAKGTHVFFYGFLIINPLVGWVATSAWGAAIPIFGLFTLPAIVAKDRALSEQLFAVHEVLGILFVLCIFLHVGAALYHGLIKKDGVLSRML